MRFAGLEDLKRLVDLQVEESSVIEYKSQLPIQTRTERRELLKDLTGMGNGDGFLVTAKARELDYLYASLPPSCQKYRRDIGNKKIGQTNEGQVMVTTKPSADPGVHLCVPVVERADIKHLFHRAERRSDGLFECQNSKRHSTLANFKYSNG